ncbi:hypothetical protein M5K25_011298 [Dendrobium thyrsiflorum]|uniref:Uncharacterized protein n=1 Tax=Dendrobium thyrsiflorum TaxID=117978 RepID=A0ABD0V2M8_DENTH
MSSPHALILPFPVQGHIIPLMELSYCLMERGFHITFINTEFNHERIFAGVVPDQAKFIDGIHFVTIPDGLEPEEDRHSFGRLTTSLIKVMPNFLEELMRNNAVKFTCFIADIHMAWALSIAKNMGLRTAAVWPAAAGVLVAMLSIPKLIQDEVIDENDENHQSRNLMKENSNIMKKGIATTDEQVDGSMTQNKKSDEEFNSKAVIENTLISKDVREEIHNEVPNSVASKGNEIAEKDFGNPDEVLQTKLRRSLRNLFFWSKYKLKELNKDILNLQEDECSEEGLSSNKLLILRWKLHELNIILARIASWWKQRAKSKWLEEDDSNSHFFIHLL